LKIMKWKHCKCCLWIYKHREANYGVKILLKHLCNKRFHKWHKTHLCTQNMKTCVGCNKLGESDMDGSNPCGDQTTHFTKWMESLNVASSTSKCKNVNTMFEIGPTICISLTNEGKTSRVCCCSKAKNSKMW
jgi:hypothetical protein